MKDSKLYIIGARGSGVLFVKTNPFRLTLIPHKNIMDHDSANPGSDGYAIIAAAARAMIAAADEDPNTSIDHDMSLGIEAIVSAGVALSDVDFAFLSDVSNDGWDAKRKIHMPINSALENISPNSPANPDSQMSQAVMDDTEDGSLPPDNE